MKTFFVTLLLFTSKLSFVVGQSDVQDILKKNATKSIKDSTLVRQLIVAANIYRFSMPDSSILLAKEALNLARQLNFTKGEGEALNILGEDLHLGGNYPQALDALFNALRISRDIGDHEMESNSLDFVGISYVDLGEYSQGLNYLFQSKSVKEKFSLERTNGFFTVMNSFGLSNIGEAYEKTNLLDSAKAFQELALIFQEKAFQIKIDFAKAPGLIPLKLLILRRLGTIEYRLGNNTKALNYWRGVSESIGDILNPPRAQYQIAEFFYTKKMFDSSMHYARLAYMSGQRALQKDWILKVCTLLGKLYEIKKQLDSAYSYQQIAMAMKDSLYGPEQIHKLQLLTIKEQQRQQEIILRQKEIQQEKERLANNVKMFALASAIGVFLLITIMLYRNNRQKQRATTLLQQQKIKVETTLQELKSIQSQLIQSEKMASLGELTAGIAHEIQNPLNFMNNFSELNKELLLEMKDEMNKGNTYEAKSIADNLIANEEKINHHGKRADSIVKGMLMHSRQSTGQKEFVDINAMAEEYFRLSYHGFRGLDKNFHASMKSQVDNKVGKIKIVSQDLGRVFLNLFNNAFFAVAEKRRKNINGYEPCVTLTTRKLGNLVEVRIKDNGNGIPPELMDKIFQPFFTTKPAGQGTGLGLSISYDIIKTHSGELTVDSKAGEYAEFTIQLPF